MNYLIGDFLIRLKNAARVQRAEVKAPLTRLNLAVAKLLQTKGVLTKVEVQKGGSKMMKVALSFTGHQPVLRDVRLFSKPGRRYYSGTNRLPFPSGKGMVIISTSHGVMTAAKAKKLNIGGEIIAALLLR